MLCWFANLDLHNAYQQIKIIVALSHFWFWNNVLKKKPWSIYNATSTYTFFCLYLQKYKLSHGSTPSPTDSEKAGNYFHNIAFRPSSTDDGSSGKRVSSIQFDTGRYDPHDNDDVFVISHADSSVYSQKSKQKRVESNRTSEENPKKARTRKICSIIIFIIVIIGLIAGIAVIVYFALTSSK